VAIRATPSTPHRTLVVTAAQDDTVSSLLALRRPLSAGGPAKAGRYTSAEAGRYTRLRVHRSLFGGEAIRLLHQCPSGQRTAAAKIPSAQRPASPEGRQRPFSRLRVATAQG